MVEYDDEDDILARAVGDVGFAVTGRRAVKRGVTWAARRLTNVRHEEVLILDMSPSAAAEAVRAALAATKEPVLSHRPAIVDDRHRIGWFVGGGVGKLNPVLITVSLTREEYGTVLKIRGAAKEGIINRRSARKAVDGVVGVLVDLVGIYEVVDIID